MLRIDGYPVAFAYGRKPRHGEIYAAPPTIGEGKLLAMPLWQGIADVVFNHETALAEL
jgi:hypothetical protein